MPTVDPADFRGLVTTLPVSVEHLPHSSREDRPKPPPNAVEGCAGPRPRLRSHPGEADRVPFLRVPGFGIQGVVFPMADVRLKCRLTDPACGSDPNRANPRLCRRSAA
jgi:hypothetical protein